MSARREMRIDISMTEVPQYRRLIEFLADVSLHADTAGDPELDALVDGVREDLMRMAPRD